MVAVVPLLTARPIAPVPGSTVGPPRLDVNGDPLPAGALARVGTVRFRHEGAVFAMAFSPDGKTVYSVCQLANTFARAWAVADGRELRRFGDTLRIFAIDVSPDGSMLVTGEDSNLLRLWNTATGQEVRRIEVALPHVDERRGRTRLQYARWVRFGPGGKTIIAAYLQGNVVIAWDTATGKELRRWPTVGGGLVLSHDGRRMAMGDPGGIRRTAHCWSPPPMTDRFAFGTRRAAKKRVS
jgi:WD40 repeat protein